MDESKVEELIEWDQELLQGQKGLMVIDVRPESPMQNTHLPPHVYLEEVSPQMLEEEEEYIRANYLDDGDRTIYYEDVKERNMIW